MATLNDTTNMLNSTQQLVSDTEAIGSNVLSTLGSQREQLLNANKNVRETKSVTGQAKVLLRNMGRRAIYNKIFLYFVILALAAANGCIIWFQYLKPSKK
jgi:vesicle transport through interaction with t-SNAREs protein 1